MSDAAGPIPPYSDLAIRVIMLPKDTNPAGTVFGGVVLSNIDLAGAVEARRHTAGRVVTKSMREVQFVAPVHLGDLVSFYVKTVARGRTSVTVEVRVDAQRTGPTGDRSIVHVTSATIVYVAVDSEGTPVPLDGAPA
ncbi:MAG: acyl-CoA thioesterase [Acidimicrobiaceae bacterium]|nr:acyl-CoA thioesterase [Acidimicrobiaceae bacterium]